VIRRLRIGSVVEDTEIAARRVSNETLTDKILKIDHAGEHGAVNIYRGQILVCRLMRWDMLAELVEFQSHEERHRSLFQAQLRERGQRRCRSYHFCGVGGLLLGVVTALLGKAAIAATTLAVESVVLKHLRQQLDYLRGTDVRAFNAISSIVAEEQVHHDRSALIAAQGRVWPCIVVPIVTASTELVIWLGMRL
jgi:3-demethoxyubiquinol 3-hydroxylase